MFRRRMTAFALVITILTTSAGCGNRNAATETGLISYKDFAELPDGWYHLVFDNLRYTGGHNSAEVDVFLPFALRGKHARYYLAESENWNQWGTDEILDQLLKMDDCIQYVKDWFGYENTPLIDVVLIPYQYSETTIGFARYELLSGAGLVIWYSPDRVSFMQNVAHEAVHAVTYAMGDYSYFTRLTSLEGSSGFYNYLEEGLANLIGYYYAIQEKEYYDYLASNMRRGYDRIEIGTNAQFIAKYEEFSGGVFTEDTFDFTAFTHANAFIAINRLELLGKANMGLYVPAMRTYMTAMSFVNYLLQTGTKEQFLDVYNRADHAPIVYGKKIDFIYNDWLEFLGFDEGNK